MAKTVLVTGANRGLGKAAADALRSKGYRVIYSARDLSRLPKGVETLEIDMSKEESIARAAEELEKRGIQVDVLINNAGTFPEGPDGEGLSALKTRAATIRETLNTNTIGPALLIQRILPGMLARNYGRVVNVSSGMGQLSGMDSGYLAYRMSKTALNAVTKVFANEARGKDVLVNSVCPGWVRTDMGGASAQRSLEEGIAGILWAATLPDGGPSGGFFRDGKPLDW